MNSTIKYKILKNRFIIVSLMFLIKDIQLSIINVFGGLYDFSEYSTKTIAFNTIGIISILGIGILLVQSKFFDMIRDVDIGKKLTKRKYDVYLKTCFIGSIVLAAFSLVFDNISTLLLRKTSTYYFCYPSISFYIALFIGNDSIIEEDV